MDNLNHCAYQVTLTQIFKNLTKILSLFGGKSYLIQTQNSDLAEIIKGKSFNSTFEIDRSKNIH